MVEDHPRVPEHIHKRLLAWRAWNLGAFLPREFHVIAESIESRYLAEAGNVYDDRETVSEAIRRALRAFPDHKALEIELALLRLPRKAALALRLHYIGFPRLSIKQKMRALGLGHDAYFVFVCDSAGALASRLGWPWKEDHA